MKNKDEVNRNAEDVKLYLAIIDQLVNSDALMANGIEVSERIRRQAINREFGKLISALGIKEKTYGNYIDNLSWKENSPEYREFNDILTHAAQDVNQVLGKEIDIGKA